MESSRDAEVRSEPEKAKLHNGDVYDINDSNAQFLTLSSSVNDDVRKSHFVCKVTNCTFIAAFVKGYNLS